MDAQIAALMAAEAAAEAGSGGAASAAAAPASRAAATAGDEFELVALAQAATRVSGVAVLPGGGGGAAAAQLLLALGDNSMEVHALSGGGEGGEGGEGAQQKTVTTPSGATLPLAQRARALGLGGHRSDVRAVAVSGDGALLLSGSTDAGKVWNARSGACLRTLPCKGTLVVSAAFGPADKTALLGCKDGSLKLFDLASGDLLQDVPAAHGGPVWALALRPDKRGAASGSSDKEVKFWEFEVKGGGGGGAAAGAAGQLALVHVRTLRVGDEVLALRYSRHGDPQKRLLAVALLDATVKVFFEDTLKFFLSLYGHKLPVLAMDVSSDGTLLVTASSDKNVKLWGLDFGVRLVVRGGPPPFSAPF